MTHTVYGFVNGMMIKINDVVEVNIDNTLIRGFQFHHNRDTRHFVIS